MSQDRTITRKRNKLIIAAAAGTLTVATAASAAAASWPSGSPAWPAGTALNAVTVRSGQAVPEQHAAQAHLAAWHVKFATEHQALTILAHQQAHQAASSAPATSGSARSIAKRMLAPFGWSTSQFSCLEPLWAGESGWTVTASNPSTGAYGIPQALPGSKMASAGSDWRTNAVTQIRWGLTYIKGTYGSPCAAWSHARANGWY